MQEKATISRLENIIGWIGSIILSISLFLAAFLLAMDCAKAESTPQYVVDYYETLIDNSNIQSQQKESLMNLFNTYSNTILFEYPTSDWCILVFPHDNMGFCSRDNNASINYIWGGVTSTDYYSSSGISTYTNSTDYEANGYYIIQYVSQYNQIYCTKYYGSAIYSKDYGTYLYYGGSRPSQFGLNGYGDFPYKSSGFNKDETICYINDATNIYTFYITQFNRSYQYYRKLTVDSLDYNNIQELPKPPSVNTSGFDCYKLDTKGGIYFIADYSSLITFDHSTTNTSIFYCDVHLDDIIQTITLDSTSEYYVYDVDHREAEYSFPITAFVPNYTEYEHVWIDNVKVINTYSGHGGSADSTFVYITPIDILGSFPEEELTPTIIPQVSPVPDNLEGYGIDYYSGDELKTLYNNNMFNQWITESEFYSDIAQLGGGRSVKLVGATDQNVYENNTDNTLAYLSNVASILSGTADVPGTGAVMTVVYGVNAFFDTINAPRNNGQIDFNGAAEEYIKDNLYSSTYDIIILEAYYDAEALQTNSNDLLYTPIPSIDDLHAGEPYAGKIFYVILTQRYIESLNLDGLGSLQKLLESDVYYTKATYEYLYDRLNDFEDKSLDGIKDILGIDNQIFDKLGNIDTYIQRIEGLLKKILDAILSLNIQPTDTTAIEQKLDDIYTRLGNSNLNSDWYKRYREWLYDETNDNVLNTPHEYMLNTFDDVKSLFDVFAYFDLPQTGFWSSAREYLNRMNGNTYNDNINDYLVTGIGSQNFYKDNCNTLVWSDIE